MASTSAFFTDSEASLQRKIDAVVIRTSADQIDTVYEIEQCLRWIETNAFKQVALQFPDELMGDAVMVTSRLQENVAQGVTVFILGDTSYGSCCVDQVAAQHYNADCVIHFGRTCLSQPCQMPVKFVFGQMPLDIQDCVRQFCQLFPDTNADVVFMYDTVYAYISDDVTRQLSEKYSNLVVSSLVTNSGGRQTDNSVNVQTIIKCGRKLCIPSDKDLRSYFMFYIGQESLTLTNLIYNFQSCQFSTYNPVTKEARIETINVNKMLMKRYFMIEKAKDARIVGILIGTLGVSKYREMLNHLKVLLKKAGKKSYVFIVGKINVAKLANFMEIDIFVLIACSENSLLDSSEFYKPVVTPFEMEVACNSSREWTGDYPTDFSQLLQGGSQYVPVPDHLEQDEMDVSLVTGRLRRLGQGDEDVETGTALVARDQTLTVATQADTAGEFLEMRSWKGLQQDLGETPVTLAVEGQRGIAMGYAQEPTSGSS